MFFRTNYYLKLIIPYKLKINAIKIAKKFQEKVHVVKKNYKKFENFNNKLMLLFYLN